MFDNVVFYWNMEDVIGYGIALLFIIIIFGLYGLAVLEDKYKAWKRKR